MQEPEAKKAATLKVENRALAEAIPATFVSAISHVLLFTTTNLASCRRYKWLHR